MQTCSSETIWGSVSRSGILGHAAVGAGELNQRPSDYWMTRSALGAAAADFKWLSAVCLSYSSGPKDDQQNTLFVHALENDTLSAF